MTVHEQGKLPRPTGFHAWTTLAACLVFLVVACEPQPPAPVIDGETGQPLSSVDEANREAVATSAAATVAISVEGVAEDQPGPAAQSGPEVQGVPEPKPQQVAQGSAAAREPGEVTASEELQELAVLLGPDPVASDDRPVVAILLPLSDTNARQRALAVAMENAARLAIDDLGAGAPRLAAYDTAGGSGSAVEAARLAVADGAGLILGPLLGRRAVEIRPIAQRSGVNVIAFSTDASAAGDGVFLMGSLPSAEFRRILRFAAVERGYRTLAAILPGNSYGAVAKSTLERVAAETGSEIAGIITYGSGFESAQEAALAFADLHQARVGPGGGRVAVLIPDSGSQLATLAAFLAQRELLDEDVQLLGTGVWDAEATIREDALRGGWFAAPDPRRRAEFSRRYVQRYGSRPPLLASFAYDAAVVAGTLAARGGEDTFSVSAITDPAGFLGVAGAFRFTGTGLNERALAILRVDEGGFRILDSAPDGFSDF